MKFRNGFVSNSSSEAFICTKTDYSLEEVKNLLKGIIEFHNEFFEDRKTTFEEAFKEPHYVTEEDVKELRDEWGFNNVDDDDIGRVMIESAGDNTIPHWTFDIIRYKFNAWSRFHLG